MDEEKRISAEAFKNKKGMAGKDLVLEAEQTAALQSR